MTITRGFTEEADKLLDYLVSASIYVDGFIHGLGDIGNRDIRCSTEAVLAQLCVRHLPRKQRDSSGRCHL